MDYYQIGAYLFLAYLIGNSVIKGGLPLQRILNFRSEFNLKKGEKTNHKDTTKPDETYNILEVDPARGRGRLIRSVSADNDGYVKSPNYEPIEITTPIPAGTQLRLFHKKGARDLTGAFYNRSYKLNPSAPEMVRALDMGGVKRLIQIALETDKKDNAPLILAVLIIGGVYIIYNEISTLKDVMLLMYAGG